MNELVFKKITSDKPVIDYLTHTITTHLKSGQEVLWLLSGGSYIDVQVSTSKKLSQIDLSNLTVSLTDERYGAAGHADSNWRKLQDRGFKLNGAKLVPILKAKNPEQTKDEYAGFINTELHSAGYKLGCVGVGEDGHTLGVLCNSPVVASKELVEMYQGPDFKRITLTLGSLGLLDEVVVYMVGKEKKDIIDQIADGGLDLSTQPAQMLNRLKKVIIFNDYKGEPA